MGCKARLQKSLAYHADEAVVLLGPEHFFP